MRNNRYSPTYTAILDLLFKTKTFNTKVNKVSFNNGTFTRDSVEAETARVQQTIYICDTGLFKKCTPAAWHLVGTITDELKEYNALWQCSPEMKRSGSVQKAIKHLIELGVLIKTETTNIYLVNPLFIRRGDFHTVLVTTANLLQDSFKVLPEHITNKKPVREAQLLPRAGSNSDTVRYGYPEQR